MSEVKYEDGKPVGVWKVWDNNGKLIKTKVWDKNGKLIKTEQRKMKKGEFSHPMLLDLSHRIFSPNL